MPTNCQSTDQTTIMFECRNGTLHWVKSGCTCVCPGGKTYTPSGKKKDRLTILAWPARAYLSNRHRPISTRKVRQGKYNGCFYLSAGGSSSRRGSVDGLTGLILEPIGTRKMSIRMHDP